MTAVVDLAALIGDARPLVARLGLALHRITTADLYAPEPRPHASDEDDLTRHRQPTQWASNAQWLAPNRLAKDYTATMRAVHDCGMALLGLDDLADVPACDEPPMTQRSLLDLGRARLMAAQLDTVLEVVGYLDLAPADTRTYAAVVAHLLGPAGKDGRRRGVLDLAVWRSLTRPRCRSCDRRLPAPDRAQCWACAKAKVA